MIKTIIKGLGLSRRYFGFMIRNYFFGGKIRQKLIIFKTLRVASNVKLYFDLALNSECETILLENSNLFGLFRILILDVKIVY